MDRTVRVAAVNAVHLITMGRTARAAMASAVRLIIMDRIVRAAMVNAVPLTIMDRTVRADIIITGAVAVKANLIWIMRSVKRLLFLRIHPVKAGETIKTKRSR